MLRFSDSPAPGNAPCEEQGRDFQEHVVTVVACQPAAGTTCHLRGPGDRFRLSGYRVGTGSFVTERPYSQLKRCQIIPQARRNSASKGLRAAAGFGRRRGRLSTPSNSISQVSGRWGPGGGLGGVGKGGD